MKIPQRQPSLLFVMLSSFSFWLFGSGRPSCSTSLRGWLLSGFPLLWFRGRSVNFCRFLIWKDAVERAKHHSHLS